MKTDSQQGFTLVEVLIAFALVGIVTALAVLLLHSTRQITRELQREPDSSLIRFRNQLQHELDHLLPGMKLSGHAAFELSPEEGLHLISLQPDDQGIPHAFQIQYQLDGRSLRRIATGGIPVSASTNIVAENIRTYQIRAVKEEQETEHWPTGDGSGLPHRIVIEAATDAEEPLDTTLDLPASFRIEPIQDGS